MRGVYRSTGITQSMSVELRVEPEAEVARQGEPDPASKQQNQQ